MLTRFIVAITSQYTQISNHDVVQLIQCYVSIVTQFLKVNLWYINYASIKLSKTFLKPLKLTLARIV